MMEFIWVFLSAALAGIGTGLVGLSAATVMVPMLITLCPSFFGETGAYVEALSKNDSDTFYVPLAIMAVLLLLALG